MISSKTAFAAALACALGAPAFSVGAFAAAAQGPVGPCIRSAVPLPGGCTLNTGVPDNVAAAMAAYGRPQSDVYRDKALKTADVLSFAGVEPGMVVADVLPGDGYYTRLLSWSVGAPGDVYMLVPVGGGEGPAGRKGPLVQDVNQGRPVSRIEQANSLAQQPEYKNVTVYWEPLNNMFAVPKQVDLVLLAGGLHVLKGAEFAKLDTGVMHKNIYETMKSGGTYVVIDNASGADRVDPASVKAEITKAGFVLDGESNLLAPNMFMLRFRKPANAPSTDMRPPNPVAALSGYFGNTRRGNVGDKMERRVMYHPDMSYQEYGAIGDSPFQSGVIFYRADGQGCMLHKFPLDQLAQVNCSTGRAVPYKKAGDKWNGADDNRPYELVKGLFYFEENH